jgi:hypothetical protein
MRKGIGLVALALLGAAPALADVVCQHRKKGTLAVRAACKARETQVDLAAFGAVGPKGDKGDPGAGFTGLETATSSATDAALGDGMFISTTVSCPMGKWVLLGRCRDTSTQLQIDVTTGAGQTGEGAGYTCRGRNGTGGPLAVTISADVWCAPFPG